MKSLSCVRFLVTPWTAAYQTPQSMGFSRQEYWSGLPLPSPTLGHRVLPSLQSASRHTLIENFSDFENRSANWVSLKLCGLSTATELLSSWTKTEKNVRPLAESHMCSVQLLSRVWLFVTPWTWQASLSIINSWIIINSWLKLMFEPSNHLILCRPLLLPSIFPSIRIFSNESVLCIR